MHKLAWRLGKMFDMLCCQRIEKTVEAMAKRQAKPKPKAKDTTEDGEVDFLDMFYAQPKQPSARGDCLHGHRIHGDGGKDRHGQPGPLSRRVSFCGSGPSDKAGVIQRR